MIYQISEVIDTILVIESQLKKKLLKKKKENSSIFQKKNRYIRKISSLEKKSSKKIDKISFIYYNFCQFFEKIDQTNTL